jgi:predicted nucleic acid-binding protein
LLSTPTGSPTSCGEIARWRKLGVTVHKTIDTVIASRCIESGYDLLHSDRDFDPFARHLGLRVVRTP